MVILSVISSLSMYTFRLHHGMIKLLDTPIDSIWEYYKLIFQLQCQIKGTANAFLWKDGKIIDGVKLGCPPCQVYNSATNKWCTFEEFRQDPFKFAFIDRQKFAFWIQDKLILSQYGF